MRALMRFKFIPDTATEFDAFIVIGRLLDDEWLFKRCLPTDGSGRMQLLENILPQLSAGELAALRGRICRG